MCINIVELYNHNFNCIAYLNKIFELEKRIKSYKHNIKN